MTNNSRLASNGMDCRWWLMVGLLLIGAAGFLVLPSLMLKTTPALPVAAVSIAIALVAWLRQGSRLRRTAGTLIGLAGIIILIVALSRPAKEFATVSSWRTATACMLMGFALMVGLLTTLASCSRPRRSSDRSLHDRQADDSSVSMAGAELAAAAAAPAAVAASAAPVIPAVSFASTALPAPQIDAGVLERILAYHKSTLIQTGGATLSPDSVVERVRSSVRAALNRLQGLADAGDSAAKAAVEQAVQLSDLLAVQAVLAQVLDMSAGYIAADTRAAGREFAGVCLLCGRTGDLEHRLEEILANAPEDPQAMDFLALAAELRGDLDQAESWYHRLLACTAEPFLRAGALSQLGLIYQTRDDLDNAEQMHRLALGIAEQLGRLDDVANQLAQLGAVHEMRGQVDLAESMYRRALAIHEQLGRLEGMAGQYVNLGLLASQRDDLPAARDLYSRARDLFTRAGLTGNARLVQQLLDELVTS